MPNDIEIGPEQCVTCGIEPATLDLDATSYSCSNCGTTFTQCDFCDDRTGTNVYSCPECGHTDLVPRLKTRLAALPVVDDVCRILSSRKLRRMGADDETVADVVDTAMSFRGYGLHALVKPIQIRSEFVPLVERVVAHDPSTLLEIGTGRGGTFYVLCRCLTPDLAISIDLPGGIFGGGYPKQKIPLFEDFAEDTTVECIRADSHRESTLRRVREILDGETVDFLFVDGDHTYEGVKRDFEMYSSVVADDGIVAFHDVAHQLNDDPDSLYGVGEYWDEIAPEYRTETLVASEGHQYGIGIVYMGESPA